MKTAFTGRFTPPRGTVLKFYGVELNEAGHLQGSEGLRVNLKTGGVNGGCT